MLKQRTPLPSSGHPLPAQRGEGRGEGIFSVKPKLFWAISAIGMKARTVRRISQVFFFSLFLFFVFVTDLRYLKGYPVSLFLELDPLVAFATAITTHTVYMGLLWSLLLIIPTLLFGRIFCNWICPYGILHHFIGWLLGKGRAEERERIEANRYRNCTRSNTSSSSP